MAITLTARDPRWNLATKRYGRSLVLAQTKSTAGPGVNRGLTPIYVLPVPKGRDSKY